MVSAIRVATCWSIMFSVIITHSFNTVGVELTKCSKATNLTTFFSNVTQAHLFYSKIRLNSVIRYCKCSFTAERSEAIKSLTDPVPNGAESPRSPPLRPHFDNVMLQRLSDCSLLWT